MNAPKKILKRLVIPVTPFVVLAAVSLIISVWAFTVIFTTNSPSALLAGIAAGISQLVLALYIIDRLIVRKFTYKQIFFGELLLILFLTFFFLYSIRI